MRKNIHEILMLSVLTALLLLASSGHSKAQNVAVNTNGAAAHSSAMLDVSSTTKGMLIPRMTSSNRTAIASPAEGLIVYDTNTKSFWYYSNSIWNEIPKSAQGSSFTLPYSGSASSPGKVFSITNTNAGAGSVAIYGINGNTGSGVTPGVSMGLWGDNSSGIGVVGTSINGVGTYGLSFQNHGVSGYSTNISFAGVFGSHANAGPGVLGEAGSGGTGLYGRVTGTSGKAGFFENTNAANPDTVFKVLNNGTGISGYFTNPNVNSTGSLVTGDHYGKGGGIYMKLWNAQNNSPGLYMYQYGNGDGLYVGSNKSKVARFYANGGNADTAVTVSNDGTGVGLQVNLNSVFNTKNAMNVLTKGTGQSASFEINNSTNSAVGVNITTNGTGRGLQSTISNNANDKAAVYASSSGAKAVEAIAHDNGVIGQSTTLTAGVGVFGQSALNDNLGIGIKGISYSASTSIGAVMGINNNGGNGVYGTADGSNAAGVYGNSTTGSGVYGYSESGHGIYGVSYTGAAIYGYTYNGGNGVNGFSNGNNAVGVSGLGHVTSGKGAGVSGSCDGPGNGVEGHAGTNGYGVYGEAYFDGLVGVYGESLNGHGVQGVNGSSTKAAILGVNSSGDGVAGTSNGTGYGVFGTAGTTGAGIYGRSNPINATGRAALFEVQSSQNTYDAVVVNNAGLAGTLRLSSSNSNNNVTMVRFTKSGTGDYMVLENGNGDNQIRFGTNGVGFFNGGTLNSGADMAEAFDVDGNRSEYEPGDVLIISTNKDRTVVRSDKAYSTLVAGVYATKPGVLMTEEKIDTDLSDKVPMGVVGVIPTKVCLEGGEIKRGDLLVTSSTTGVAMKGDIEKVKPGQVIGKALENFNSSAIGKIKVLVNVK